MKVQKWSLDCEQGHTRSSFLSSAWSTSEKAYGFNMLSSML